MMKILLLLTTTFIALTTFSQQTTKACSRFKTGKFSYQDSAGIVTTITRTTGRQIEVNTKTGVLTKSKISWLGECEYKLTQIWANRKAARKNNRRSLTIQIVKTNGNQYEYSCSCNDPGNTIIKGVITKISDK